jgi:hypothetical protein
MDHIAFSHPSQNAVRVDIVFNAVQPHSQPPTSRAIGAVNYGKCIGAAGVKRTPLTGSDITNCFPEVPLGPASYYSSSTVSDDIWLDDSSGPDYAFFTCSPNVVIQLIVTWANGHTAEHDLAVAKPVRVC